MAFSFHPCFDWFFFFLTHTAFRVVFPNEHSDAIINLLSPVPKMIWKLPWANRINPNCQPRLWRPCILSWHSRSAGQACSQLCGVGLGHSSLGITEFLFSPLNSYLFCSRVCILVFIFPFVRLLSRIIHSLGVLSYTFGREGMHLAGVGRFSQCLTLYLPGRLLLIISYLMNKWKTYKVWKCVLSLLFPPKVDFIVFLQELIEKDIH